MIQTIINSIENWLGFIAVCFAVYIVFIIALRYIRREEEKNKLYGVGRVAAVVEKIQSWDDKKYER